MKVRIAFLMHGLAHGGAPRSLLLLIKSLNRAKYEIVLYTIKSKSLELETIFRSNVDKFVVYPLETISTNQVFQEKAVAFERKKSQNYSDFVFDLKKARIDILHINSSVFPHIVDWVKAHSKIKVVTHVREWLPDLNTSEVGNYLIENISKSDGIIAISDNEAKVFETHPNIKVIPNPFDFDELPVKKVSTGSNLEVLMLGQFHESKGHLEFVKALHYLIQIGLDVDFKFSILGYKRKSYWKLIVKKLLGMEDYGSRVLKTAKQLSVLDKISLIPFQTDVLKRLNEADIVVRPSLSGDPWGRDIIESMALGKPIVATGTSEFYVLNNKTGFLVNPEDTKEIAERIRELLLNADLRERFGALGALRIREMCDAAKYAQKVESMYDYILE